MFNLLAAKSLQAVAQVHARILVFAFSTLANALKVESISGRHTGAGWLGITRAALSWCTRSSAIAGTAIFNRGLGLAMGSLLANQSALGLLAICGAVALPITQGFFTHGFTLGLRVTALSVANRFLAHGVALGTSTLFTMLDRATDLAFWLVAFNLTLGAANFLASGGALRLLANRFANLVTDGAVAFPLALGVAVTLKAL